MDSNQGFRRPPKQTPGSLGVVMEDPVEERDQMPNVLNPSMGQDVQLVHVERMDKAAKTYKEQEKMVEEQMHQMRVDCILGANTWDKLHSAFRQKSE